MIFENHEEDSIFTILGITEEWEDDEVENLYTKEDTKALKEYGY